MKTRLLSAAIGCLLPLFAHAQAAAPLAPNVTVIRPMIGMLGTFGGDKLADVVFTDGTTSAVTAGGLVQMYVGADIRPAGSPVSMLATVGYHVSRAGGDNGDINFERIPFEFLGMFDAIPGQLRIGGGLRYDTNVNLNSSGVLDAPAVKFDDAVGGVLQAEWMTSPHLGIVARYVNIRYGFDAGDGTKGHVNGNHGGIGVNWYF
jgi:hypothetical protein